ncbi:hypothetical protein Bhyg_06497 [Pseudolycoriella hygida]|uniref:Uncharacterized protein n=1 Tax=Pseudolycoriella hygida TaxID=35572 RepID=A0A9Q0N0Y1_9DIPT|nr:hypothetical protein Bhyg_06497 [Pseudolycoriella hygida]
MPYSLTLGMDRNQSSPQRGNTIQRGYCDRDPLLLTRNKCGQQLIFYHTWLVAGRRLGKFTAVILFTDYFKCASI